METDNPPPWRLTGEAFHTIQLVEVARARRYVPAGLRIVPIAPGRTLGGVYLGRYSAGSTLQYRELAMIPALVADGPSLGFWVSHIYVDSAASLRGGREIWGLPKEEAAFDWTPRRIEVRKEGELLCALDPPPHGRALRLPFALPALGQREGRLLRFVLRGAARPTIQHAVWHSAPGGPLAELGMCGRRLTVAAAELDAWAQPPAPSSPLARR